MNKQKNIALLMNLIIPGIGTIIAGKNEKGVIQTIMAGSALLLVLTLAILAPTGFILAISLELGALIWSEITVAKMDDTEFKKK